MMKRIVAILFFLSLFLVALALIAPGFIDWSQHKDRIVAQLEPYLGRHIDVGGQVKFRLLPNPQILLEDVSLANAPGAKDPAFMKLKQLEAHIRFQPLLQGRFEVETINLANPEINLEILDDGTPDWTGILKERDAASGIQNEADAIVLNQVTVTGGAVHYFNHVTGAEWRLDNLDLAVSADTLFGPYRISGDMQYKGTQVGLDIGMGKFGAGAAPVPVHIALNPVEKLPQVKLEGTIEMQGDVPPATETSPDNPPPQADMAQNAAPAEAPGPLLRGDLSVAEGNIASLFDSEFLNHVSFLGDNTDATGTLLMRSGEIKVSDIKAKFGKKGEVSGTVDVSFEKGKTPALAADLSGSSLKIADKPGFAEVPDGLDMHLRLKGKALSWGGALLPAAAVVADTAGDKWTVKSARVDLPGKSVIKLTGAVTPSEQYAAYNIQLATEDLGQMLRSLPLAPTNLLKTLDGDVIKKLTLSSSVDVKKNSLSFSDIDGTIEDKIKLSGVLTTTVEDKKPSFRANLNLDNADMSVFAADAWSGFTDKLVKTPGDIALSVKNFSKGDLKVAVFTLSGATGEGGLQVKDLTGSLGEAGDFALNGKWTPGGPFDLEYKLKTSSPGAVAKALEGAVPPPLKNDATLDVQGHVGGDAKKYTFNLKGHGLALEGSAEAGEDGIARYHETFHLDKGEATLAAATGLPLDKLLTGVEGFSADVSGTHAAYKMDKIAAGPVSGWLSRKETKYDGELKADTLDFDGWLDSGISVNGDMKLKLAANKLLWRSNEISDPVLTLEAGSDHIKIADLKGGLWGGTLTADLDAERKDGAWKGSLKGTDSGADLGTLAKLMEILGLTAGKGDLDFDLHSDGKAEEKEWFHGVDGTLKIKADSLMVHNFATGPLADMIAGLKHLPEHLAEQMEAALNSGSSTFKDVQGSFKLGGGKITIEKIKLSDADAVVSVTGGLELGPSAYHLSANVQLRDPADVPSFFISRAGTLKDAPDYTVSAGPLAEYLTKHEPKEKPPAPLPPVTPTTVNAVDAPSANGATPADNAPISLGKGAGPLPPDTTITLDKPITIPANNGGMDGGGNIDTPIEAEPLAAPPPVSNSPPPVSNSPPPVSNSPPPVSNPPPPVGNPPSAGDTPSTDTPPVANPPPADTSAPPATPAPDQPPPAKDGKDGAIKGILDRLNDTPPADQYLPQ